LQITSKQKNMEQALERFEHMLATFERRKTEYSAIETLKYLMFSPPDPKEQKEKMDFEKYESVSLEKVAQLRFT